MLLKRSALFLAVFVFGVTVVVALVSQAAMAAGPTKVVQVQFVNDVQAGFAVQDVFVERNDIRSDQVARLAVADAKDPSDLAKPLFTSAAAVSQDLFKFGPSPLGPFPKGQPLGFTLQQWLAPTGSGTYTVTAALAQMSFSFQNLVPNGTYTVWCSRLTLSPVVKREDIPTGAADGSQSVFKTDAKGNGSFSLKMKALPDSTQDVASVVAIVYHSDGKTYGPSQGDSGFNSHTQLFYMFPAAQPFFTPVPPTPGPSISAEAAQKIAEDYLHAGKATKVELDQENGQFFYTVGIGSTDVKVDGKTGQILGTEQGGGD